MGHNRRDNDGHRFKVPTDLLDRFDDLFDRYCKAKRFTDEYYDLEAQFNNEFERYMVG
jgi:hypothetical protein